MRKTTSRRARREGAEPDNNEGRANLYDEVTARIVSELEARRFPWVQPWGRTGGTGPGLPRNALTARSYSGVNVLILWGAVIEHGWPSQSWLSKASKGTMFLGYTVITVTGSRVRRTKLGRRVVRSRDCADRIHLRVPHDRLVRFNKRKGYGDFGRLKAMHRRYLVNSSPLEIVLAYNAEMRGLANYYRLAYVAKFSLRKLWFLWETSLLKTLAFKLRLSVNKIARRLRTRDGLAVRFTVDGKERSVAVFNLKDIDRLPNLGPRVDRWVIPHFTKGRSDVMDRLRAKQCEYCGSADKPCEVHHSRRLVDMKDTPLWKQVAAARRRKRIVLCLPCHKALHAGQLKPLDSSDMQARRAG